MFYISLALAEDSWGLQPYKKNIVNVLLKITVVL